MNAEAWADEWIKTMKQKPWLVYDRGVMIGWFSNAIMAGYDHAAIRTSGDPAPDI